MKKNFNNMKLLCTLIYIRLIIIIINISFNSYLKFKDLKQRALIGNFTVPKLPVFNMVIKGNDKSHFICALENTDNLPLDELIFSLYMTITDLKIYQSMKYLNKSIKMTFYVDRAYYDIEKVMLITPTTDVFKFTDELYTHIVNTQRFLKHETIDRVIVTVSEVEIRR